jgi:hypothetical protein
LARGTARRSEPVVTRARHAAHPRVSVDGARGTAARDPLATRAAWRGAHRRVSVAQAERSLRRGAPDDAQRAATRRRRRAVGARRARTASGHAARGRAARRCDDAFWAARLERDNTCGDARVDDARLGPGR